MDQGQGAPEQQNEGVNYFLVEPCSKIEICYRAYDYSSQEVL